MVNKSTAAKISNETYNEKNKRARTVNGFNYVKGASNKEIAVFYSPEMNEYIIAHRGTKLEDNEDIEADLNLLVGQTRNQKLFKRRTDRTKGLIQNIKDADPNAKIILSGHSLGGATAVHALNDDFINNEVDQVITFNPGASPIQERFEGNPNKITNHITFRDPIHRFGNKHGKVLVQKSKSDPQIEIAGHLIETLTDSKILGELVKDLQHHSIKHFF